MGFDFGNMGDIMALQQKGVEAKAAFAELRAAISSTDFAGSGQSRFSQILGALDKLIDILKFIQGLRSLPQAQQAAAAGLADTQALRDDVAAGNVQSKEAMTGRVDALLAKYKAQLGPFASALE